MKRKYLPLSAAVLLTCASGFGAAAASSTNADAPHLSVSEIVQKNVAARGGLESWRTVQTVEIKGKMDAGGNNRSTIPVPGAKRGEGMPAVRPTDQAKLPFVMDLERGRKMRLEIEFNGQTAIQVYNGTQGWKVRPFLNRHQVENYTPEELKTASTQSDLDGFLIDYAAKGNRLELEGVEEVEGRNSYKLKVTDKSGFSRHLWVDAGTFLEAKIEGTPRRLDGKYHPVTVYYRDYRPVKGLMMPYLRETTTEGIKDTEKIEIETIVLNPKLDETKFAMPR